MEKNNLTEAARAMFAANHKCYEFWSSVANGAFEHATDKLAGLMAAFAAQAIAEERRRIAGELRAMQRWPHNPLQPYRGFIEKLEANDDGR